MKDNNKAVILRALAETGDALARTKYPAFHAWLTPDPEGPSTRYALVVQGKDNVAELLEAIAPVLERWREFYT